MIPFYDLTIKTSLYIHLSSVHRFILILHKIGLSLSPNPSFLSFRFQGFFCA